MIRLCIKRSLGAPRNAKLMLARNDQLANVWGACLGRERSMGVLGGELEYRSDMQQNYGPACRSRSRVCANPCQCCRMTDHMHSCWAVQDTTGLTFLQTSSDCSVHWNSFHFRRHRVGVYITIASRTNRRSMNILVYIPRQQASDLQ